MSSIQIIAYLLLVGQLNKECGQYHDATQEDNSEAEHGDGNQTNSEALAAFSGVHHDWPRTRHTQLREKVR